MEFQFVCERGEVISGFTRSSGPESDTRVKCEACDNVYARSITLLSEKPV